MAIKSIQEKIALQIKSETDPDKLKALSEISADLDKAQADEDKLLENNTKLLDLYKASIGHEGSKEAPSSPTAPPTKTYETILSEAIKEASSDAGKEK